jgi:tetratricopeptide (TPR) repeat protein
LYKGKDEGEDVTGKLLDDALDALEEAVRLDPRSTAAYYYLGAANYKSSFYEEAEAALSRAAGLEPNMSLIRLLLANVYLKQKKWREVVDTLDAYLQVNPKAADRAVIVEMRDRIQKGIDSPTDK